MDQVYLPVNNNTSYCMGTHKHEGDAALALAEECAEVIQVITKKQRFEGEWDEIPPGKDKTRFQELSDEMTDLIFQWERLKNHIAIKSLKLMVMAVILCSLISSCRTTGYGCHGRSNIMTRVR